MSRTSEPTALGWDARWAADAAEAAGLADVAEPGPTDRGEADGCRRGLAAARPGRVGRMDGAGCVVLFSADTSERLPLDPALGTVPVTGDWVLADERSVRVVLPRRTAFVRGAGRRAAYEQVLAANVDVVLLTVPLSAAPNLRRLDRTLALAWQSGAEPVVVLTKADLSPSPENDRAEVAAVAPGVPVLLTSTVTAPGVTELAGLLRPGRTLALIGASGTGKSSLVNALSGAPVAAVGDVRADGRGRHTTTARELLPLPGGAWLLDTPGLRGVQLWDAEEGLARTFTDVEALAADCRFTDCRHTSEPGCAVLAAVESRTLTVTRLESYRKLGREQEWLASRYDARLRAERRRRWQAATREANPSRPGSGRR